MKLTNDTSLVLFRRLLQLNWLLKRCLYQIIGTIIPHKATGIWNTHTHTHTNTQTCTHNTHITKTCFSEVAIISTDQVHAHNEYTMGNYT